MEATGTAQKSEQTLVKEGPGGKSLNGELFVSGSLLTISVIRIITETYHPAAWMLAGLGTLVLAVGIWKRVMQPRLPIWILTGISIALVMALLACPLAFKRDLARFKS